MIEGKALKVKRIKVSYDNKEAFAGYSEDKATEGADALISFIVKGIKANRIADLIVDNKPASIIKITASEYIDNMYNFQIKFKVT